MSLDLDTRRAKAGEIKGREVRRATLSDLELREVDGQLRFTGWASVTERSYDMGWYSETIKRGAFTKTLSERPDVQMLINHEGLPLARSWSNNLRLSEDERGLRVEADLDPTDPDVERLAPKVERGDIDQMSFAFSGAKSVWDDQFENREITELSLHRGDVSVVNQGANPYTSFQLRDAESLLRGLDPAELAAFMRSLAADTKSLDAPPAPVNTNLFAARATALRLRAHV